MALETPEKAKMNSPESTPPPDDAFDFFEALEYVLKGKKIHKLEWKDEGFYGFMKDEQLHLHKPAGTVHPWIISYGDMTGTDYIVLED